MKTRDPSQDADRRRLSFGRYSLPRALVIFVVLTALVWVALQLQYQHSVFLIGVILSGLLAFLAHQLSVRRLELHRQTELLEGLFSNLPVTAIRFDERGELVEGFGAGAERLGLDAAGEALDVLPAIEEGVGRALAGETVHLEASGGHEGEERTHEFFLLPDPFRRGVLGFAMDVSDRRRMAAALQESEERARQSQKMEAVGRLAGGIAHDFNNLLTAILGYARLGADRLPAGSSSRRDFQEIQKACLRASRLVSQLLAFSRRQIVEPRVFDFNRLLREMDPMLRRLVREDVELVSHFAQGTGRVSMDRGQMEQVVVNLVVNAQEAISGAGWVTLETDRFRPTAEEIEQWVELEDRDYIRLRVADTGIGMDEEVLQHIFEPFFTTKDEVSGTGLGLATVYGIVVEQAQGHIRVESEVGKGTTFVILLPRTEEPEIIEGMEITESGDLGEILGEAVRRRVGERAPNLGDGNSVDTHQLMRSELKEIAAEVAAEEAEEEAMSADPGSGTVPLDTGSSGEDDAAGARAGTGSKAVDESGPGGETILLVEDEDMVRELAQEMLESLGYRVWVARNGLHALEVVEGREQQVDLLLTDVVMPKMGGEKLYQELRRLHPEVKVLYSSGYTESAVIHHGVKEGAVPFIHKPYTFDGLAGTLRQLLDR